MEHNRNTKQTKRCYGKAHHTTTKINLRRGFDELIDGIGFRNALLCFR